MEYEGTARYILMNKNTPVVEFDYDLDEHRATRITGLYRLEFAPPALIDGQGQVTKKTINQWWLRRAIPASRHQIQSLLMDLRLGSTLALAERSFGLSLSDCYWLNDAENPQAWDKVNFFDNDFADDLGMLTLGQSSGLDANLVSPNATLGGDLMKKWTIAHGQRELLKSGSSLFGQEVYNEVVATALHARLLNKGEYVPYVLRREGNRTLSACPNMLEADEELIAAYDLIVNRKKPNNMSDFQFLVARLEELGLSGVVEAFSKMFTCDFIVANFDRHYRNFGVIRNVETLEYVRLAPIFDTGNSLWCRSETLDTPRDYEYLAKPFGRGGLSPEKQLKLFHTYDWFDPSKLDGFVEEAAAILGRNPNMPRERIELVCRAVERKNEYVTRYAERNRS